MNISYLNMKLLAASLLTVAITAQAEMIYHKDRKNTLLAFQQFLEGPLNSQNRSTIKATREGIIAQPSNVGGFTLFKFRQGKVSTLWCRPIRS